MSLYIVTKVEDEDYAIEIDKVQSIEKIMKITRVPKAKSYVEGVVNIRGDIIPIISLREKLGFNKNQLKDKNRIVILKHDDILIGIIVDSANEIVEIDEKNLDVTEDNDNSITGLNMVDKICKIGNRILLIVNLDKLIS
ncbi:chemotaxis protein CheW [Aceticella autotrophica]|uniref:Chemotaxis protein CheW n=1 Tax=Aceticella autotrophica TaxID=2755338 RepID=A0A974Y7B2_9THEO|nr:chemotaxis protein CheW [Aceticella autotrophica]MDI6604133.1 chemotaxis protein CheW [Thermoanaerobacteraceae bacterium]QSZ26588.1 chemotaxis protein CheW [Aceticella autotrophica]